MGASDENKNPISQGSAQHKSLRSAARTLATRIVPSGLSYRLLALTVLFVLIAQIVIYVPSLGNYRNDILMRRLEAAQLAALSLEVAEDNDIAAELTAELLANAEVLSVILKRDERRSLFLSPGQMPAVPAERYDLVGDGLVRELGAAFALLFRSEDRVISVRGVPRFEGGVSIEAVMMEAPVREELFEFSWRILRITLILSAVTGALGYGAIHLLLVRPMLRIERSMSDFRAHPENAGNIIAPSDRRDELGSAERELSLMQADLRQALNEKARLAALGTAVSKINHDLRNMLTSAQLFVDRLEISPDPTVQRLAPKLVNAIGRAVNLCTNTLKFGRAEEAPPSLQTVDLHRLVDDVMSAIDITDSVDCKLENLVSASFCVYGDADQIYRVLLNLCRNASQAIQSAGVSGRISICASSDDLSTFIEVADTGPGIPEQIKDQLFEPFSTSGRPGGTGLGLAIANELIAGHGGRIELKSSGADGTVFLITLPKRKEG